MERSGEWSGRGGTATQIGDICRDRLLKWNVRRDHSMESLGMWKMCIFIGERNPFPIGRRNNRKEILSLDNRQSEDLVDQLFTRSSLFLLLPLVIDRSMDLMRSYC